MAAARITKLSTIELLTLDGSALAQMLADGKITSVSLMEQVLAQIDHEDKTGAKLNAILSLAPRKKLFDVAAQLDEERKQGNIRGPYHGIPILVKDAISTHPNLGMLTTVGSHALKTSKPAKNAGVIDELIKQGLIILAKTNLNEFCNWKGFGSVNGYSAYGGQTQSAYIVGGLKEGEAPMGHTSPLGSSTGSAVGVSAGYSPLSIGTETDGSLVQPAARAALFSMKPTVGSTDTTGVWTLSLETDAIGAMAKSVADLAYTTELLQKKEVRHKLPEGGYKSALTKSYEGLKVAFVDPAIWHLPAGMCPQIPSVVHQLNDAYFNAIDKIRDAGAAVTYPVELTPYDKLMISANQTAMSVLLFHDYKRNVDHYLENLESSEVRSLKDLIDWNKAHADIEMPYEHANQGRLVKSYEDIPSDEEFAKAKEFIQRVAIDEGFNKLFVDEGYDVIGVPQDSKIPSMSTASGYPIATMPLGVLDDIGRPFGLAIMARHGREDLLFQFMSAFEAVFPKRAIPPQLVRY